MNLVFGSLSSSIMASLLCFSVMSEYSLDEPGFTPPVPPVPPSSSESSVETPADGRRKCIAFPRRMSRKTADRHILCVNCRGFDCYVNNRCEECLEWSEEEVTKYAKYRKSLKSRASSSKAKTSLPTPPPDTLRHPLRAQISSPKWTPLMIPFNLCLTILILSFRLSCHRFSVNPSCPVSPG